MMRNASFPLLILAPMEGVTDFAMRRLLTGIGGVDLCVSEFLRVSINPVPARVVRRHVPESAQGWMTAAGTPVVPQILGGDPGRMAETADTLVRMGAPAVDLNFGCPAKTVNRHDGGAALLQYPPRIAAVIGAVKREVAGRVPVTAKIRLGWENPDDVFRIAATAEEAGAERLTVHARTKADGYTGKARWDLLRELRRRLTVPLVANGDIATAEEFRACREETGCEAFMIGRGALSDPWLFLRIRGESGGGDLGEVVARFVEYSLLDPELRGFEAGRVKQFVRFLAMRSPAAAEFFAGVRQEKSAGAIARAAADFFSLRTTPPTDRCALR